MARGIRRGFAVLFLIAAATLPAAANPIFFFSTGNPDGLIATLSRPASAGKIQTETADDFALDQTTMISSATFTGLLPLGTPLTSVNDIEIELYHVFPVDSAPPSGSVLTRTNSPSDSEFLAFNSKLGQIQFTPGILSPSFTVLNSVVNGINKLPNQFTGGEGSATGQEVEFNILFTTPFTLPKGQYFFRPEVGLDSGNFLWLSAPKPIVSPGTPFAAGFSDLQSWIRNDDLAPDWSRIGTDITHQGPFNAAFSLSGEVVPEPSSYVLLMGIGFALIVACGRQQTKR